MDIDEEEFTAYRVIDSTREEDPFEFSKGDTVVDINVSGDTLRKEWLEITPPKELLRIPQKIPFMLHLAVYKDNSALCLRRDGEGFTSLYEEFTGIHYPDIRMSVLSPAETFALLTDLHSRSKAGNLRRNADNSIVAPERMIAVFSTLGFPLPHEPDPDA